MTLPENAVWHDVECGGYRADLEFWRELAEGAILDVGAGTGRIALRLAEEGHDVTALDLDGDLGTRHRQYAFAWPRRVSSSRSSSSAV